MSIPINLKDNQKGNEAQISDSRDLHVVDRGVPAFGDTDNYKVFRDFFKNICDSSDMRVNASPSCPELFFIEADPFRDTYIHTVNIVIADAGAALNEFGSITALTNPIMFFYEDKEGEVILACNLVSNFEFVRLGQGFPQVGTGASTFRANNVEGASEGFIPSINMKEVFGLPWGVPLRAGTNQKIAFRITDNTSPVDQFNAIGYGIQISPPR